jgi:fermentation-respiration switch protein FrsA (DUF1100 family)
LADLVRSSDSFGNASAIVTSVVAPYYADPSKMVSFQFGEDSASVTCAPSYATQFGARFVPTLEVQFEMLYVATMLNQGYYVVMPDYEGAKSAFTAGRNSGQATLDSLRATYATANMTGLDPDAKTVLWGYSGGTVGSAWATVLLEDYAPELKPKLLGAALGSLVTNITATVEAVNGKLFAGLIANAINGLQQEYPELDKYVLSQINPSKLEAYNVAKKSCLADSILHFANQEFIGGNGSYFPNGWSILNNPIPRKIISENTLALKNNTEYPHIPIFIYHGMLDEVVPHRDTQRAYDNWCKWGQAQSIELSSDMTNGHVSEFVEGAPAALAWIEDRFNGKPTGKGCKDTTRFSNLFYPGVNKTFVDLLHGVTSAVFTKPLGPNGENITPKDIENMKRDFQAW